MIVSPESPKSIPGKLWLGLDYSLGPANIRRESISTRPIVESERTTWEKGIANECCLYSKRAVQRHFRENDSVEPLTVTGPNKTAEVLDRLVRINSRVTNKNAITNSSTWEIFAREKYLYLKNLTDQIRKGRDVNLVNHLLYAVDQLGQERKDVVTQMAVLDLMAICLMVGQADRILVGTHGGLHFKSLRKYDGQILTPAELFEVYPVYLRFLTHTGEKQLPTIPVRPAVVKNLREINVPRKEGEVKDIMYRAFFDQKYVLYPEVPIIHDLKGEGNVSQVVLVRTGKELTARFITPKGEVFVWLDLENWNCMSSYDVFVKGTADPEVHIDSPFVNLLARVYRDLVAPKAKDKTSRSDNKIRSELTGRRVEPHPVVGYTRPGNMTDEQGVKIGEWEEKYKMEIAHMAKPGLVLVLPYFCPRESGDQIATYPDGIRGVIQKDIEQKMAKKIEEMKIKAEKAKAS